MADTAKVANFILKDAQGNIQVVRSLTDNDTAKIRQGLQDIEQLMLVSVN